MRIAGLSDIGLVRAKNEDAYWFDPNRAIFILADGLGGHKAGEVAAALAVRIAAERLSLAVDRQMKDFQLIDAMQEAFGTASEEIYSHGKSSEKLSGMGCSLIAGILQDQNCYVAHAGDSRAYLYFDNTLSQMTVDDTPVAALIKRGYLLPEKARSHNLKNFLVKSIGTKRKSAKRAALAPTASLASNAALPCLSCKSSSRRSGRRRAPRRPADDRQRAQPRLKMRRHVPHVLDEFALVDLEGLERHRRRERMARVRVAVAEHAAPCRCPRPAAWYTCSDTISAPRSGT